MSISISEPMRLVLDALYEGKQVPPDVFASLTDAERKEVAALARTARIVNLSLNQPVPTAEMESSALARAHAEMAKKISTPKPIPEKTPVRSPEKEDVENNNWFTRLFKKPGG